MAAALLPGRPLLYNGQEVESPQHLPLFERDPVAWNQADTITPRAFYKRILRIADTDSMFLSGQFGPVATGAPKDVIAYSRGGAVVLVNARNRAVKVTVSGFAVDGARELLTDGRMAGDTVSLGAYGAAVLER